MKLIKSRYTTDIPVNRGLEPRLRLKRKLRVHMAAILIYIEGVAINRSIFYLTLNTNIYKYQSCVKALNKSELE